MALTTAEIEKSLSHHGFQKQPQPTKKAVEFIHPSTPEPLYVYQQRKTPALLIHPKFKRMRDTFAQIPGVFVTKDLFRHHSNARKFPTRVNKSKGKTPIHYGIQFSFESRASLDIFIQYLLGNQPAPDSIDARNPKAFDAGRGVEWKGRPQMTETPIIGDITKLQSQYEPTEQEGLLEQEPDNTPLEIPPDKRRVKTDKQDVPIETLHLRIKKGRLDIQPEFQRYYVWSPSKASKLIESVLLEIPIPVVYLAEEQNNRQSVVDGQQRITSIIAFLDGIFPGPDKATFKLTSLQVLKELNGLTFKDLDVAMQEKILSTALRLVVIEKDSDPDVKFEVFERLNVGAVALNDQELRNCVYRGPYNTLLRELSRNEHLLKVLRQDHPHPRMQDRQLILRLLAMWRKTHLKYKAPMKQFLNHEMEENKNANPEAIEEMREVFTRSIEMAYAVFGRNAFRRYYPGTLQEPNGSWEPKKLNIALWDTILYGLSYFEKAQVIPIADAIREEFLDLMCTDGQFLQFITSTTDQPDRVQYRGDIWIKRLRELVGYKGPEPRTFSLALKQKLYDANPACAICGQHMHDIDDTEVDHIVHYWRGGATSLDNARLTHRFCNRQRGSKE